jgi:hypothetical protein
MNFYENWRKPDPLARQLAASLDALKDMNRFRENIFPPSLIFLDSKVKQEQVKEFIARTQLKILPSNTERDKTLLKLEMKAVSYY